MNDAIEYLPEGICPSCHEGKLEEGQRDFNSETSDGRQVVVKNLTARTCSKCGESIFPRESLDQIEAAVLKAMGALTPEQIERFVEMTGLREDELSERLGLGAKTIYRWRRGAQRPSKSLSVLLAAVAHHPNLLEWIGCEGWTDEQSYHSNRIFGLRGMSVAKESESSLQFPRLRAKDNSDTRHIQTSSYRHPLESWYANTALPPHASN